MSAQQPGSSSAAAAAAAAADRVWRQTLREEQVIHAAAIPPAEMKNCYEHFDTWAACFGELRCLCACYRAGH
jgi:homoserine kinase